MDLAAAVDLVRARVPCVQVVWLYGSHARGNARLGSDVDLALLAEAPVDPLELLRVQTDLAVVLGTDVDLVDLFTADDVVRVQVIEYGRVVYEQTPSYRARFEMHALSRYAHLNEERRGILEDIVHRGSVYG